MANSKSTNVKILLTDSDRYELEHLARKRKVPPQERMRAKVILACAEGLSDRKAAAELGVHHQTVANHRQRYLMEGVPGLRDRDRSGRPRLDTDDVVEQILAATISKMPEGGGPWSLALMRAMGWNPHTVSDIWQKCGVKAKEIECSDIKDGLLVDGDWYVAGFFRGEMGRAVALCLSGAGVLGSEPAVSTRVKEYENGDAATRADIGSLSISETDRLHSFLNALETAVDDGHNLQLVTDSPLFHIGALVRIWEADCRQFQVFSARNAAAWDDLIDKLIGVMEERWWTCGAHDRGTRLAEATYDHRPMALVWRPDPEPQPGGVNCRCACHRTRLMMPRYMSRWAKSIYDASRAYSCQCNDTKYCLHCCYRRYRRIVRKVTERWVEAFGDGPVIHATLTYRSGLKLSTRRWLVRARDDFEKLRCHWKRDWGNMPPYLISLEWTARGMPHFHILIPWQDAQHFQDLGVWLWETWTRIVGGRVDRRTRFRHSVSVSKKLWAYKEIEYILKTVKYPLWQVSPPGTPRFRRWYASHPGRMRWQDAPRPTRLVQHQVKSKTGSKLAM